MDAYTLFSWTPVGAAYDYAFGDEEPAPPAPGVPPAQTGILPPPAPQDDRWFFQKWSDAGVAASADAAEAAKYTAMTAAINAAGGLAVQAAFMGGAAIVVYKNRDAIAKGASKLLKLVL